MKKVTSSISRRQFLGRAAGAAVTASTLGVWSQLPAAQSASPGERLNLAGVGVGNRGANNLYGVKSENIVALCDVDRRYLDQLHHQFSQARTYRDFRELIDQESDLDGVVISTPDHTHAPYALQAMHCGLHVYCEKPLARTVAEVRRMAAVAKQTGVVTQMGNQHHSSQGYRRVVELVQSGTLGAVRQVHVWTNRPLWPQGIARPTDRPAVPEYLDWDLWLGPAPERPYHSIYHPFQWRGWWDFGCGALGDMGPHLMDPAFWALKLTAPSKIVARHGPSTDESAPAWSIINYEFAARGELPPVQLTWYDGGQRPPREVVGTDDPPANGTLLLGESAKLFAPELGGQPILIANQPGASVQAPPSSLPESPNHYQQWLTACKRGGPANSDFTYGALLTETCLLGNVAIRAGRELHWDSQAMSVTNVPEANSWLEPQYRGDGWTW